MPDQEENITKCTYPDELKVLRPKDFVQAGKYLNETILKDRPDYIKKGHSAEHDDHFEGLSLEHMPAGKIIKFHYWDEFDDPHPDVYHVMVPGGKLIGKGREYAKCIKDEADASHTGPGSPRYVIPLGPQYDLWKEDRADPIEFFCYQLGDYTFGHCGG